MNSNTSSSAPALQPPIPRQPVRPDVFSSGTILPAPCPPVPLPLPVPSGSFAVDGSFSFKGNSQLLHNNQTPMHNGPVDILNQNEEESYISTTEVPLATNTSLPTNSTDAGPLLCAASVVSAPKNAPGLPGHAGHSAATLSISASTAADSSPVRMPIAQTTLAAVNPSSQQRMCPPYQSMPGLGAPPQGLWLHPPQYSGGLRSPYLSYPPVYHAPFPLAARGTAPLGVAPDSHPLVVAPLRDIGQSLIATSSTYGEQVEVQPPGTDVRECEQGISLGLKDATSHDGQAEAWSAHRTETGAVYYYNAISGESTYEKPPGFQGEPDKVTAQPTPVSWEKLAGTDWALVTTNDGKNYYYNTKAKVSSWQIPTEVIELKKKQENINVVERSMSVPNSDAVTDKGSATSITAASNTTAISAPALNTGGRDSTALRTLGAAGSGSSAALDLIKMKLQDSGALSSSSILASTGPGPSDGMESSVKGLPSENNKDRAKETDGEGNLSDLSSDSGDEDSGPTKEERVIQYKEMLKERGVAPFSKWDKELPKIVFDPRFKAIPTHTERRSLFEHFVRTRAEEERKEKRAAQKAAIEGFKNLLEDAKEDINEKTDYQTFRKRWGHDSRFEALDRKDREALLNERIVSLKKASEEKTKAVRLAAASGFMSLLRERGDITTNSRWSRVKDSMRDDPRFKAVRHENREILFDEYILELKTAEDEAGRLQKAKREEQEKLRERKRETRKRKEREEQEMERVRLKVRRKEAVSSYQALLVETIKDPQTSWKESKPRLEKDPQGRAANPDLDESDMEKLFREHVKMLYERCTHDYKALLSEVITAEAAARETDDRKTVLSSWSTAKGLLKADPRYAKMPRKDREALWRRHTDEIQRKKVSPDGRDKRYGELGHKPSADVGMTKSGRATHDRR